jgi:molybdate transport system substrate-binding protein
MKTLHLLSGGAAQGLVSQLEDAFEATQQCAIDASFGAVGMMRDNLLAGSPCDLVILTGALVEQLTASGHLVAGSSRAIGAVKTGIAVKAGSPLPRVGKPAELKAALQAASEIYFPDPVKATAGIHFFGVLEKLGLEAELADRLRPFPNGAAAMNALAEDGDAAAIGCTQATEILYTEGVTLVADLPREFELATTYTAAVCSGAREPDAARALIAELVGPQAASIRAACGFEPA